LVTGINVIKLFGKIYSTIGAFLYNFDRGYANSLIITLKKV